MSDNNRFKFRIWDVQGQNFMYFDLSDKESLSDFGYFATEECPDYNEQMYLDRQRQIELAKKSQKSIIEMAKNKGITKEMIISYCSVIQLEDFNKNVLFAAVDSEGEYFFEE